ncbi:MAG: trehalose-phosphatase, partial [Nitriliruptoraceae bacterium]
MSVTPDGAPTAVAPADLAARLLAAGGGSGPLLLLDHDGTLSPIAPTPDAADLPAPTRAALADVAVLTDVAVVSGRGLDDLVARLGDLPLTLVAEHGLRVRRSDGAVEPLAD